MNRKTQAGVGVFLFVLIVAQAFTGGAPPPRYALAETCHDGLNNDGDVIPGPSPIPLIDGADQECHWMPFDFWNGEYDGQGISYPIQAETDGYVALWNQQENLVSHFEAVKYLHENHWGTDVCNDQALQDSLVAYRDSYGLSDSMTGVSDHQSECGVSY